MSAVAPYSGPQCPRCETPLFGTQLRTGDQTCPSCGGAFEATAFEPPQRVVARPELVVGGPEEASACAYHARNAAVTSCHRCGVFICALCEMNVGTESYCPRCFERVRSDGSLKAGRRYRDYAMMARTAAFLSVPSSLAMLGIPFAAVAIYYAVRGRRQRIDEGRSPAGMYVAMLIAAIVLLANLAFIGWIVWAVANT